MKDAHRHGLTPSLPRLSSIAGLVTLLLSLGASVGQAVDPEGTTLDVTVLDPVSQMPIAGAEVRLVNEVGVTAEDGSVLIEHPRRKGRALWTGLTAAGHAPYVTWTEPGRNSHRQTYLFPTRPFPLPGRTTPVDPRVFARHFDVVYRDDRSAYGRLIRWMEQPEIVLLNRIVEPRMIDGAEAMVTTDELVGPRIRRRVRRGLRRALAPLTGGFLRATRPRIRKLPAGHVFDQSTWEEQVPRGELVVYVRKGRSSYAVARVEEEFTIIGGAAWVATAVLENPQDEYRHRVVIHEIGHTVGMFHPYWNDNATPLCSVISYWPCSWFSDNNRVTPVDRVTGRLAYGRLPGNDHDDVDLRPLQTRLDARAEFVLFDDPLLEAFRRAAPGG